MIRELLGFGGALAIVVVVAFLAMLARGWYRIHYEKSED